MSRIVSWFSCGAASAVATKLALETKYPDQELQIAYCDTRKREHPDNMRFLADCEKWFGQEIHIVGNDEYDRDPDVVFLKTKYLVGPKGARCTAELKKSVRWEFQRADDIVVIGFTVEEYVTRHKRLQASEPFTKFWPILYDNGVSKNDCYRILSEAGIDLPEMYKLGYKNNNCIGCVKGQAGYWNKIRVDFPERFAEMAAIERTLGRTICKIEGSIGGKRWRKRVYLDELSPEAGRYESEADISCGILYQTADAK